MKRAFREDCHGIWEKTMQSCNGLLFSQLARFYFFRFRMYVMIAFV